MDYILGAISFFLSVPETEYALMLNGPWGSGKTHFYKAKIKPLIESRNFIPCYVSLNGMKSTDEIARKMLLKANPSIMRIIPDALKEAFCALYPAGKAFGVLNEARLEVDPFNIKDMSSCVFVFDDLERICIDVPELLGFFNNFVEHSKIKCLFITNEAEIISKYQVQTGKSKNEIESYDELNNEDANVSVVLNDYLRIKEKIVGKTLNFCPEISMTVTEMASEIISDEICRDVILQQKGYLEELNNKYALNLRGLKGAFFTIDNLARSFPVDDPELKGKYLSRLFRLINAVAAENSEGNYTLVDGLSSIPSSFSFFSKVMVESNKEYQRFFSKYGISEENTVFSAEVVKYLSSGNLDREVWKEEILPSPDPAKLSDDPLEMFDSFALFSDEELRKKIDLLFDKMNSGSIQFMFFPKVFQFLEFLIQSKAIDLEVETVIGKFLAAIEKSRPEDYENATFNDAKFQFDFSENASEDLKFILDSVMRRKIEFQSIQLQKKALEFFKKFIEPSELAGELPLDYLERIGLKLLPFFHRLNSAEILRMIIDLSNPSLVRFINLLKQRYDFANISSYFHPEAGFFAELEKALAHEITRTRPSIRCHLLSSLQARVRTILRGLTRH
jgi:hypothetical protein